MTGTDALRGGHAMTQTIVGLFADPVAARGARAELMAAGLVGATTYSEDIAEGRAHGHHLVLVESGGRETEAREILLRAGAEGLEERAAGAGVTQAHLQRDGAPTTREGPREERHPHGGAWLREIVFGLNDGLGDDARLHHRHQRRGAGARRVAARRAL